MSSGICSLKKKIKHNKRTLDWDSVQPERWKRKTTTNQAPKPGQRLNLIPLHDIRRWRCHIFVLIAFCGGSGHFRWRASGFPTNTSQRLRRHDNHRLPDDTLKVGTVNEEEEHAGEGRQAAMLTHWTAGHNCANVFAD